MTQAQRLKVSIPFFWVIILLILLFSLGVSLSGIIFSLTFIVLAGKKFMRVDLPIIYLTSVFLILDFLRLLGLANLALTFLILCGLLVLWGIWRKYGNVYDFSLNLMNLTFSQILVPIFLTVLIVTKEKSSKLLWVLNNFGYDQVGHYAISKALNTCGGFLRQCDPDSMMLPYNYMFYPQQWHILFSTFVNTADLNASMSSYIVAVLMSAMISIYLIYISFCGCSSIIQNACQTDSSNLTKLINLFFAVTVILVLVVIFMGYPNFVLAISLFLAAIILDPKKSALELFLIVLMMMIVIASYTLFLIPATLYFVFTIIQGFRRRFLLISFISAIVFLGFAYKILSTALSESQLDYISIGAGRVSAVILFAYLVSIFGSILSLKVLKKQSDLKNSILVNVFVMNHLFLLSLLGLHGVLIGLGTGSGYYLQKMGYACLIVSLFSLCCSIPFLKLQLSSLKTKTKKILFRPLVLVSLLSIFLFSIPYISYVYSILPLRSPIATVLNILRNEDTATLKKNLSIIAAAKISNSRQLPIIVMSENTGPDSQWASSLSGYWSGFMNDYLEDKVNNEVQFKSPNFQVQYRDKILFYDPVQGILNE